jgi:hypothetical protein
MRSSANRVAPKASCSVIRAAKFSAKHDGKRLKRRVNL